MAAQMPSGGQNRGISAAETAAIIAAKQKAAITHGKPQGGSKGGSEVLTAIVTAGVIVALLALMMLTGKS